MGKERSAAACADTRHKYEQKESLVQWHQRFFFRFFANYSVKLSRYWMMAGKTVWLGAA